MKETAWGPHSAGQVLSSRILYMEQTYSQRVVNFMGLKTKSLPYHHS